MALVVSFFGFSGNFGHIFFLNNIPNSLRLAMELNHTVEDEPIDENNR